MSQAESRLLSLPFEILGEMFRAIPKPDLKILRLVCKRFCQAVTPELFRQLYLYPNKRSFDDALKLSKRPEIAEYVQHMYYNPNWNVVSAALLDHLKYINSTDPEESPKEFEALTKSLQDGELSSVSAENQQSHLTQLFLRFGNLQRLSIEELPDEQCLVRDLPPFYLRCIQKAGASELLCDRDVWVNIDVSDKFRLVLAAADNASKRNLTFLDAGHIRVTTLLDHSCVPKVVQQPLLQLRNLDIVVHPEERGGSITRCEQKYRSLYSALSCLKLQSLRIRNGDPLPYTWESDSWMFRHSCTYHGMTGIVFPYLSKLELRLFTESPVTLIGFLQKQPRLRCLTLDGLSLASTSFLSGYRACCVQFLIELCTLELKVFHLRGSLSNGGKQCWIFQIPKERSGASVLERLEQYVLGNGPWPLNSVAIPLGQPDISYEARVLGRVRLRADDGDDSCRWWIPYGSKDVL